MRAEVLSAANAGICCSRSCAGYASENEQYPIEGNVLVAKGNLTHLYDRKSSLADVAGRIPLLFSLLRCKAQNLFDSFLGETMPQSVKTEGNSFSAEKHALVVADVVWMLWI